MSTAPSSVPPPSFGLAPELPEGVERTPPPEAPRWKAWTAWVGLIAAFAGALMGALVVGVIGAAAGADISDPTPAVNISATIVQDLSFIAAALLFAGIAGRPLPEQFGLRPTRLWPAVGWMAVAFVSFYVVTATWVAILGVDADDSKLPDELGVEDSTFALVAVAFLVAVVAPIAEEFFFRGFFFTALRSWKGLWPAAILTGLVFGGIHVGSAEAAFLLPLGFFGFCLCLLYHRTGSLYPCIALHCVNNSLAFGVSQHWGWETGVLCVSALSIITLVVRLAHATWTPAPAPAG
jgi:membrane protease YdiL (CAAX protease family)